MAATFNTVTGKWTPQSGPFAGMEYDDELSALAAEGGTGVTAQPVGQGAPEVVGGYSQQQDTAMQNLFQEAGLPWRDVTPQQQFSQYAGQQFQPGGYNPMRGAFYNAYNPLMQQYYLQSPTMAQPGGSFADFMGSYTQPGLENMRQLAQRASAIANLTPGQFMQYVDPQTDYTGPAIGTAALGQIGALDDAQRLMYRQIYGTGEGSEQNRRQLANMLAMQRGSGGGMYGGILGQAIQGAMNELYDQLIAQQPGANFLDWYLGRTSGLGGVAGRQETPAVTNGNGTQV